MRLRICSLKRRSALPVQPSMESDTCADFTHTDQRALLEVVEHFDSHELSQRTCAIPPPIVGFTEAVIAGISASGWIGLILGRVSRFAPVAAGYARSTGPSGPRILTAASTCGLGTTPK